MSEINLNFSFTRVFLKVVFTRTYGSLLTLVSVGVKDRGREEERRKRGASALLEEEKRLRPPAVNKVDSPTDGLNDRAAECARNGLAA